MGENIAAARCSRSACCSTAYLWHNYGKSTIGSRSDIERVPIENLQALLPAASTSRTTRCSSSPASSIRRRRSRSSTTTFGKIPRPTRKLSPTYTVEPVQDGERSVTLRRTGDVGVVGLVYHGAAGADADFVGRRGARRHPRRTSRSGRLYKALVDKGLAAKVESDVLAAGRAGPDQAVRRGAGAASRSSTVRDKHDRHRRGAGQEQHHAGRGRSLQDRRRSSSIELRPHRLGARRRRAVGVGGAGRLAPHLPAPRRASRRSTRRA